MKTYELEHHEIVFVFPCSLQGIYGFMSGICEAIWLQKDKAEKGD